MSMNLYQKILAITGKVGKQSKTGRNSMQNYSFIEQSQVVAALRPLLEEYGVVIKPEVLSRTVERYTTPKGTTMVHVNLKMQFTVINADDPKESFICEWDAGEAMDTSDKATNKAATAADKYFKMKLFNISDKDDADVDSPELPSTEPTRTYARRGVATPKQVAWIRQEAAKVSNFEHASDIDKWLSQPNVLNMSADMVPISKVSDAVEKIRSMATKVPELDIDVSNLSQDAIEAFIDNGLKDVY